MSKKYRLHRVFHPRRRLTRLIWVIVIVVAVLGLATLGVRQAYYQGLKAVSSNSSSQEITIPEGSSVDGITKLLTSQKLIRSAWAFRLYIYNQDAASVLQAGTYSLSPSMSVNEIVSVLTHGKVVTDLVTILPGKTLAQIQDTMVKAGYRADDVKAALNPSNYPDSPALVDKPAAASLEGFLYPDSYQKDSATRPQVLIQMALAEMQSHLTPDLRSQFAAQGLSTYQGLVLASIVEKEVPGQADRAQVAQVFLSRLRQGMPLGSDVTAYYGSDLAGVARSVNYDSPYNTRLHTGLPPTPIGTVSQSSLDAVANPAKTDWLYFVTGDDKNTYFSHTLAEHQALVQQHCQTSCQ